MTTDQFDISIGNSRFHIANNPDNYQRVDVFNGASGVLGVRISDASGEVGYCDDKRLSGAAKESRHNAFAKRAAINAVVEGLTAMAEDADNRHAALLQAAIDLIEATYGEK
jgi:hypothetical protein